MKIKKIGIIGIGLFLVITSYGSVAVQADDIVTGISDAEGGVTSDMSYWYPTMGRILYNNGYAKGMFVHFNIDENTGTIFDYTVKLTFYPMDWYSLSSSYRSYPEQESYSYNISTVNKTIFTSIQVVGFDPVATPNAFADYLIVQGKNTLMKFFDVDGGSINYASGEENTKLIFEVPEGFNVSQLPDDPYYILPIEVKKEGQNSSTEVSTPPLDIIGEWELVSYGDVLNPTPALQDVDTFISFNIDSTFGGNVGCNSFGGNFNFSDGILSFDSIMSTEMYCEKIDAQEQGVLNVFSQADLKYQLDNENLSITNGISVINLRKKSATVIDPEPMPQYNPWQTIWIKSDNTTTSINSYNGTVSINGQTIEIELSAYGYLDIYTWIEYPAPTVVNEFWYNDLNITQEQMIIEDAKNNGIISAEAWVTGPPSSDMEEEPASHFELVKLANTASNNYYTYDDPTFEMTFKNVDEDGVDIIVNSEISSGRIVIINVDKAVIEHTSVEDLLVSIDESGIDYVPALEELMEKVEYKDTDGGYFALSGDQLVTLFVYVPHFSEHTISIRSVVSGFGSAPNILLPIILSVLFICLFIGGIMVKKRRQQDDL